MKVSNLNNPLKPYSGVRVLVLGASGFIGRWVARALTDAGALLWITGRDSVKLAQTADSYGIKGERVIVDLLTPGAFELLFREVSPDITFNLTGYGIARTETDMSLAWRTNTSLVEEIALTISQDRISQWNGLKLVHVGSGFEYGSISGVVTEESVPHPDTLYGRTKLAGTYGIQEICHRTGLAAATARVFTAYGPGEHDSRLLPSILRASRTGDPLKLTVGLQRRDFIYVKDVAAGLLHIGLAESVPNSVVNLATGNLVSVREFAECAGRILKMDPSSMLFGALPSREDEVLQERVDITRLTNSVGWNPSYSLADGIGDAVIFLDRNWRKRQEVERSAL